MDNERRNTENIAPTAKAKDMCGLAANANSVMVLVKWTVPDVEVLGMPYVKSAMARERCIAKAAMAKES